MRVLRRVICVAVSLSAVFGAFSIAAGTAGHVAHASGSISYVGYTDYSSALSVTTTRGRLQLSNARFPDGGNTAAGVILFNYDGSGVSPCSGSSPDFCPTGVNSNDYCFVATDDVTLSGLDCTNGASSPSYTACGSNEDNKIDSGGGTISLNGGSDIYSTIYDRGSTNCETNNTLALHFSNMPSGTYNVGVYFNDDSSTARSGCYAVVTSFDGDFGRCTSVASGHGQILEWTLTDPSTFSIFECDSGCGSASENQSIGGIFFLPATPTVVNYAQVHKHYAHGKTTVTWISTVRVAGFNVFAGKTKLNQKLVTSRTNRYSFVTRGRIHNLRLVAVSR